MTISEIKNRFGIIGNSPLLEHALNVARQVAATDLTVLVTGESGSGKEVFAQIVHQQSARKHGAFIAVNCGAIPEGTIDSELFGHEKGSFTGAHEARKGYFEVCNGGTIFLDEVAELPLLTQVRLLRVLETGEFIKVGSSKVQKTDVRVVAATNVNIPDAIARGKFREDLYYRLNTVPLHVPSLRERKEDIHLLFRKFASDFAEKYRMPSLMLQPEAQQILTDYRWPGNVRQLKNVTEQLSILEQKKEISADTLLKYLPPASQSQVPALLGGGTANGEFSERELLYKVLFDMKRDLTDLKKIVFDVVQNGTEQVELNESNSQILNRLGRENDALSQTISTPDQTITITTPQQNYQPVTKHEVVEESLSIADKEKELIEKALEKYKGKRKFAAKELGISERTLYRKINEYGIKE
ncbi:MAG TPA: sigma-54 dependent transcriptional regulator [Bacteroidia bacterium]|nr:sigma-54 dependent transcriptional regulator [Bacteroidia bacterium]HNU33620.1 sigma-54 dependent transcriptional regulator [Bacteroidia bacterium]